MKFQGWTSDEVQIPPNTQPTTSLVRALAEKTSHRDLQIALIRSPFLNDFLLWQRNYAVSRCIESEQHS